MAAMQQSQTRRDRARQGRLDAARMRRFALNPGRLAREERIDEAVVDLALAWEVRSAALQTIADAEARAAAAIDRLVTERVPLIDIAKVADLDPGEVRRLRRSAMPPPSETSASPRAQDQ